MPRRVALPPQLAASPFHVSDALALGLSVARLRGTDLAGPHHGIRTRANGDEPASDLEAAVAAARAYAPLLRPGDRFSGTTAAALWGAPLPHHVPPHHVPRLHVTAGPGLTRPRGAAVVGHGGPDAEPAARFGLPVSPAAQAFLECAGELELRDLVAVADYLVLDPRILDPNDMRPHLALDELRSAARVARGRHTRAARAAAELARGGAESRPETLLRLLIRDAGLPEPLCGHEVRDQHGRRIGWFDLTWPAHRVIAEYDGDQHRTSTWQYDRDIRRFDQATDAGYRVVRVRMRGLGPGSAETVERIRRALSR